MLVRDSLLPELELALELELELELEPASAPETSSASTPGSVERGFAESPAIEHDNTALRRLGTLLRSHRLSEPFTLALRHGSLTFTHSTVDEYKHVFHHGVYETHFEWPLEGSDFSDFLPIQHDRTIDVDKRDAICEVLAAGWPDSLAPIRVMPDSKGNLVLSDGHHRLCAAMAMGEKVSVLMDPRIEDCDDAMPDWKDMVEV